MWGVIASFDRVYTSSSAPQCERIGPPEGRFRFLRSMYPHGTSDHGPCRRADAPPPVRVIGRAGIGAGQLKNPFGVAVDGAGCLGPDQTLHCHVLRSGGGGADLWAAGQRRGPAE